MQVQVQVCTELYGTAKGGSGHQCLFALFLLLVTHADTGGLDLQEDSESV